MGQVVSVVVAGAVGVQEWYFLRYILVVMEGTCSRAKTVRKLYFFPKICRF